VTKPSVMKTLRSTRRSRASAKDAKRLILGARDDQRDLAEGIKRGCQGRTTSSRGGGAAERTSIGPLKLQQPLDPRRKSNEWIYQTGDELKVFDTKEIAQAWFAKNDPEGISRFAYEVIGEPAVDHEPPPIVSSKREYLRIWPETFGDFSLSFARLRVWRRRRCAKSQDFRPVRASIQAPADKFSRS
jgi:hypothetical protein